MTIMKLSHNSEWKKYVLTSDEDIALVINKIRQFTGDTKSHPRRTRCPLEHTNPDGKLEIKQDGYMLCWGRHHNQSMWKPVGDLIGVEFEFTGGESKTRRKNPPKKITLKDLNRMDKEFDDDLILYCTYFDNQYEFLLGKDRFSFNKGQINNHLEDINKFVFNRRVVSSDWKAFVNLDIVFDEVIYNHATACWLLQQSPHITLDELKGTYINNINEIKSSNQEDVFNLENHITRMLAKIEKKNGGIKFNQNSSSGRMYCPPVSYSKDERNQIKAGKNNILIQADFSQNEPRILAHLSQDENLIDIFNNGGDIYLELAKKVYKTDEPTQEQRNAMKPVWLSVFYGASIKSLINDDIDEAMAKEIHTTLWEEYEEVKRLKDIESDYPYVNSILGRRCSLTDAYGVLQEYKAINYICQSSAADILKKCIFKIYPVLKYMDCQILFTIHDAILFECPEENKDEAVRKIKKIMESAVELEVPQVVEFKYGYQWGDMVTEEKIDSKERVLEPVELERELICKYFNINPPDNCESEKDKARWALAELLASPSKMHKPYILEVVKVSNYIFDNSIYVFTCNKVENELGICDEEKIRKNASKNNGKGFVYEFRAETFEVLDKKLFKDSLISVWNHYPPDCKPKDIISLLTILTTTKDINYIPNYKQSQLAEVGAIINNLNLFITSMSCNDITDCSVRGGYYAERDDKKQLTKVLIPLDRIVQAYNQKFRRSINMVEFKNILEFYSRNKIKIKSHEVYTDVYEFFCDITSHPQSLNALGIVT